MLISTAVCYLSAFVTVRYSAPESMTAKSGNRTGKFFSIFNVVTWKQGPCVTSLGDAGTCMTAAQCASGRGSA